METLVPGLEVPVGAQERHAVGVGVVGQAAAGRAHVGMAEERVQGVLAPVQLVEVFAQDPLPEEIALPVDLVDHVVQQQVVV
jgi:hypothetical protein